MKRLPNQYILKLMESHEKAIRYVDDTDKDNPASAWKFAKIDNTGVEIALFMAEYKCEADGCKNEDGLTLHHLIKKTNRGFLPHGKYLRQRHHYSNTVILCCECHDKVDDFKSNGLRKSISEEDINYYKKKSGFK